MFVPTVPLPRVKTRVSAPPSYVATSVEPSSFHESQMSRSPAQSCNSATFFVLASESAGYSCASFSPSPSISFPEWLVTCVGLSGRT